MDLKYNESMEIEWEAKFLDIDKDRVRDKLSSIGAVLVKPETFYRRVVYFLPKGHEVSGGWIRVRDEGDKITMSFKVVENGNIESQKEVQLKIDNYENARLFLTNIGCREKAYQETRREVWQVGNTEITIDEWPYLNPYVEIEGKTEEEVRKVADILGFDFSLAVFGAADQIISKQYGISEDVINNEISRIVFDEPNPYLKWKEES